MIESLLPVTLDQFLAYYQEPLFYEFIVGSNLIGLVTFLALSIPLTVLAVWNPAWLQPYRIQPKEPPYRRLILTSSRRLVLNFAVTFLLSCASWPLLRLSGVHNGPLPPWYIIVVQVIGFAILDDFLYYWMHRKLHEIPVLYRKFHSVHHRIPTPIAISGNYMHPLEFALISTIILIGPVLVGAHVVTVWIWIMVRQWEAATQHSGLSFPWSPTHLIPFYDGPAYHDFHHSKFYGNYSGLFSYTDRIFGTRAKRYDDFLKTRAAASAGIEDPYNETAGELYPASEPAPKSRTETASPTSRRRTTPARRKSATGKRKPSKK